jgi:hypothetical protein
MALATSRRVELEERVLAQEPQLREKGSVAEWHAGEDVLEQALRVDGDTVEQARCQEERRAEEGVIRRAKQLVEADLIVRQPSAVAAPQDERELAERPGEEILRAVASDRVERCEGSRPGQVVEDEGASG